MSDGGRDRLRGQPGEQWHQGITMHQLRFGGGVAGVIFTVGSMLIFLIGVPAFWAFLLLAVIGGIVIAMVLRGTSPRPPLSIAH